MAIEVDTYGPRSDDLLIQLNLKRLPVSNLSKMLKRVSLEAPCYLIRDRNGIYGAIVIRRLSATGIRDKPIPRAALAERTYRTADRIADANASTMSSSRLMGSYGKLRFTKAAARKRSVLQKMRLGGLGISYWLKL